MVEKAKIAIIYNNTIRMAIFGVLSILFNHWWIILFSALFFVKGEDCENE